MARISVIICVLVACSSFNICRGADNLLRSVQKALQREFVSDDDCPPGRTQTQGGWLGGSCHGNNPNCYSEQNFAKAFPSGLNLGSTSGNYITVNSYADTELINQGGSPRGLPTSCAGCAIESCSTANPGCDVTGKKDKNNLMSQTLALTLNVGYDTCSRSGTCDLFCDTCTDAYTPLADRILASGSCQGESVSLVLEQANCVLGNVAACSGGYSASEITSCVDLINNNYVDGTGNNNQLLCPDGTPTPGPTVSTPEPTASPVSARVCDINNLAPAPETAHTRYYFTLIPPDVVINNLGGYCGSGATPENGQCGPDQPLKIIRIANAGIFGSAQIPVTVDISIADGAKYVPSSNSHQDVANSNGAGYNGIQGENGQINLHLEQTTELTFTLLNGNTLEPLSVPLDAQGNEVGVIQLEMTFYDIDMGVLQTDASCTQCNRAAGKVNPSGGCAVCACGGGRDVLGINMIPEQDVQFSFYSGVPTSLCREDSGSITRFWGDQGTLDGGSNNPLEPFESSLNDFQKEVSVNLIFTATNTVTVEYEIDEPTGSLNFARNIVFNMNAQERVCQF